jgi:hypothetical protein
MCNEFSHLLLTKHPFHTTPVPKDTVRETFFNKAKRWNTSTEDYSHSLHDQFVIHLDFILQDNIKRHGFRLYTLTGHGFKPHLEHKCLYLHPSLGL